MNTRPAPTAQPELPSPFPDYSDEQLRAASIDELMQWLGRNDPCPCGSRKKHKKCCLAAER